MEFNIPLGNKILLWDEFNPALYSLAVTLAYSDIVLDEKHVQFGLREIKVKGTRLQVNGRDIF